MVHTRMRPGSHMDEASSPMGDHIFRNKVQKIFCRLINPATFAPPTKIGQCKRRVGMEIKRRHTEN
jgi:hypothetical protein